MKSAKMMQAEKRAKRRNFKLVQKKQRAIKELYDESLGNAHENIYHMSEDLWISIISYLPTVNILRLKFVCRLFHYLLSNPRHSHVSESVIGLYNYDAITSNRNRRVRGNPFTRVIPLEQLEIYHAFLYRRVDLVRNRTTVRERSSAENDKLVHAAISQEALINFILAHGQHIEHFILNGCDAVTDFVVQIIASKCVKLKRLELRSCKNITQLSHVCVIQSSTLSQTMEYCAFSERIDFRF